LSQEGRGQSIDLRLHGEDIGSLYGTVRELNLRVRLSDAFRTPTGVGDVTIMDFHRGGLLVEALEVKGEGDFQKISLAALARGRYRETFEMKTQGSLTTTGQDKHLEIRSLEGRYGECPIQLTEQTTISRLSNGYLLETLALSLGTGRLFASGRVDTVLVSFAVRLEALSLGPLHLIGSPGLDGKISGKIRIEGRPDRPEVTVALRSAGIRLLEPAFRDLPPADVSLEADLKDGVLEASVAVKEITQRVIEGELQCPVEFTLLPLSLSVPREGNLQGRILATGDLSRIMSFFPAAYQTFGGLVSVDLTLSGKIEAPELSGSVQVEDGVYENARTGTILRRIEIHAAASGQRLTISQARATDGDGGVITADGWIDIVPTQRFPLLIHVQLKKATLVRQDWATAQMDGQLGLWGSLVDLALKGGLTVEPADIRIPERATVHIEELEVIEVNKPGETAPTAGVEKPENSRSVLLDLTLDFPQRIFIRGRGLESEWEGKLQLTGTVREPAVRGTLSVVRGRFNLFGKNLTLIRGLISFDGSIPPTPILDVVAEGRRNDLTASIAFAGPPSDLQVTIESDPPLPSDEVLSHLLFGRGLADLSPLQGMKIVSAVSTLTGTGGGALDIMDRTRRLVGLDDFDVKEPTGETGEVAIGAGKYLNDDIYVEVEQGIGSTRGKLSVEYELTPNITVETEAGTDAQGGIGFNWRFDY